MKGADYEMEFLRESSKKQSPPFIKEGLGWFV